MSSNIIRLDSRRTVKLRIRISGGSVCRIKRLVKITRSHDETDVVRRALQFYDFIVNAAEKGAVVQLVEPDGSIITFPDLLGETETDDAPQDTP